LPPPRIDGAGIFLFPPPLGEDQGRGLPGLQSASQASLVKILLVKLSSLGDVVHALPVVQDIRAAMPEAQIDWVVEKSFASLLARCS